MDASRAVSVCAAEPQRKTLRDAHGHAVAAVAGNAAAGVCNVPDEALRAAQQKDLQRVDCGVQAEQHVRVHERGWGCQRGQDSEAAGGTAAAAVVGERAQESGVQAEQESEKSPCPAGQCLHLWCATQARRERTVDCPGGCLGHASGRMTPIGRFQWSPRRL